MTVNDSKNICQEYLAGLSAKYLTKKYKTSELRVRKILIDGNVKIRNRSEARKIYRVDESVFDNLNEHSLYWIGFLFADGCLTQTRSGTWRLSLGLQSSDRNHIEKFKDFLSATNPIEEEKRTLISEGKVYNRSRIQILSNKLGEKLTSYGLVKNLKMNPIELLAKSKHFWRGVIDGDGSVVIHKNTNRCQIIFLGNLDLAVKYQIFVRKLIPESVANIRRCGKEGKIFSVGLDGYQAVKLARYLYEDSKVFLDRKKAKAIEMIELNPQRRIRLGEDRRNLRSNPNYVTTK